jgi:threonine dehydrogenase-like Zn-dependent dehydrogenase
MKSHALWHISPADSEILEQDLPEERENLLLVESLFSLVSQGTERLVASGGVPDDIRDQMRVPYMEGSFSLPCKYGYSMSGRVLKGPDGFNDKLVHLMHPHQDLVWVDPSSVYLIPEGIPPQRAVLAGNLETAVNALWDSGISLGDFVLVAGFGLIGALIAFLASGIPGVTTTIYEKNEKRLQLALKLGFNIFKPSVKHKRPFDVAFNTTADGNALQLCIDSTGYGSQVTEVSFYGKNKVSLMLGGGFHTDRKRIVVSQVSRIPGTRLDRWDALRRKDLVFDLLTNSLYDSLIGNVIPFTESPRLFGRIRENTIDEIAVILKYKNDQSAHVHS